MLNACGPAVLRGLSPAALARPRAAFFFPRRPPGSSSPACASTPTQPAGRASPCASNRKRDGTELARLPYFARSWAKLSVRCRHRARDADVGQAPLLLDPRLRDRARVRQQALLHADQEHVRELEPLGGVERHERHGVAAGLGPLVARLVAAREGQLLQEAVERRLGRAAHVVLGEVQDLDDARPARLARHRVGVEAVHLLAVADALEEAAEDGRPGRCPAPSRPESSSTWRSAL